MMSEVKLTGVINLWSLELGQTDCDTVKRTRLIIDLKTETKLQTACGVCGQRTHPLTNGLVCFLIVGDLIGVTGVSISSSFCRDDKYIPLNQNNKVLGT